MTNRLFVACVAVLLFVATPVLAQLPGNITQIGGQPVSVFQVTPFPANGLTNTVITVSSGTAELDHLVCYNPNASVAYVQIFDISGSVTLGTSTPKWSVGVPATSTLPLVQLALKFDNAIKVAATTTATGSTAPGTALNCNVGYY